MAMSEVVFGNDRGHSLRSFIVYDLGGGAFDVSILKLKPLVSQKWPRCLDDRIAPKIPVVTLVAKGEFDCRPNILNREWFEDIC